MAVPKPTIVPKSKDQQQRREYPRHAQPLQYAHGWLQQELENDGKYQWQHDLACNIGCRQQREDE